MRILTETRRTAQLLAITLALAVAPPTWAQAPAHGQAPEQSPASAQAATQAQGATQMQPIQSPPQPQITFTTTHQASPDELVRQFKEAEEHPDSILVPPGTKVLLALRSGIDTRTARPGDGVYLSSTFPVVVGTHVAIPAGVYVQGVIDRVVRPGRVKGRAQVGMHFTTIIFPNGSVVSIPGLINSVPGSAGPKVKDAEGTIEQSGSKGRDLGRIARGAEVGAQGGAIGGAVSGSLLRGVGIGALAGGVGGLVYTLLSRGPDMNLEQGQTVEMVLQRPLAITEANIAPSPEAPGASAVPLAQPPMLKPGRPKQQVLCPGGTLGCA